MSKLIIGLMSGTSADGIDAVLFCPLSQKIKDTYYQPFAVELRERIVTICQNGPKNFVNAYPLEQSLTLAYANAVMQLLAKGQVRADAIAVIGCHGQTIYHDASQGLTIQLCDGAKLAYLTGIEVVCDFRRGDIARRGQGAPFAPLFHQALFLDKYPEMAVVNIGGVSNISVMGKNGVQGFDVGPGNALLDAFVFEHWQYPYDKDGALALKGKVILPLLASLKSHPWFRQDGPKSLDRESFSLNWAKSQAVFAGYVKEDILMTFVCFIADLISEAIFRVAPKTKQLLVCGGGVKNKALMMALSQSFESVQSTSEKGVDADFIEAALFAWLASFRLEKKRLDWQSVTGATSLGCYGAHFLP